MRGTLSLSQSPRNPGFASLILHAAGRSWNTCGTPRVLRDADCARRRPRARRAGRLQRHVVARRPRSSRPPGRAITRCGMSGKEGNRDWGLQSARPGRWLAAVEPGADDPAGAALHARLSLPPGDDRSHPGQSRFVTRVTRADTAVEAPPSITENPVARRDAAESDHRPVVAEFDLA
jgi:hypothetical protein